MSDDCTPDKGVASQENRHEFIVDSAGIALLTDTLNDAAWIRSNYVTQIER